MFLYIDKKGELKEGKIFNRIENVIYVNFSTYWQKKPTENKNNELAKVIVVDFKKKVKVA